MGTFALADSVTNQVIQEGEKVIALLLSHGTSNTPRTYLFADPLERLKFASLPIRGVWDGVSVIAEDDSSVGVKTAIGSTFKKNCDTFEELQEKLYTDAKIKIPAQTFSAEYEQEFSLFVIKIDTYELLMNSFKNKDVFDIEGGLNAVKSIIPAILKSIEDEKSDDDKVRNEAYAKIDQLSKSVFFESWQDTVEGINLPIVARSLISGGRIEYSDELKRYLSENGLFGHKARHGLSKNLVLPSGYDDVFRGLHESYLIQIAMMNLQLGLQPAHKVSPGYRDASRIPMLTAMLASEMSLFIEHSSENMDRSDLEDLDKVLTPIRNQVGEMVKARNSFEKEIKKYERDLD